ncbi:MAG: hypothetical protein JNM20_17550 [Rhizobiales bacterium]|nr:hypothetical protein [Hyphomicrobiales bacterium]
MVLSRTASYLPSAFKNLIPAGFALAVAAGLLTVPAAATSLSDAYHKLFMKQFCVMPTASSDEGAIDDEFLDIHVTSEDVAPLLEQLNAEFAADPEAFCDGNPVRSMQDSDD